MALFEKKFCELCNDKVNLLTRLKLSEGYLCSDCKKKLSDFSTGWGNRTVEDVKTHLAEREHNKEKYAQFSMTASAGRNNELMIDAVHRQFCFAFGGDYREGNPEVFDFSQLQDFWLEEDFSSNSTDSDADGIPDSQDNFNNKTGRPSPINMMSGMMIAPINVQPYLRRDGSELNSLNGAVKYVSAIKAHFVVKHNYINNIEFSIDSMISQNNQAELMQAYNYGTQVMMLCEQIRGGNAQQQYAQPMQQGFAQQPLQQGFAQQPYQQPIQQSFAQQPYQQPVQQGFAQQPYQQPVQQGFAQQPYQQQPVQQGFAQQPYQQQPVQQGFAQQPVQQAAPIAAVLPFCPSCGSQNATGATFCPNCGSSLKK